MLDYIVDPVLPSARRPERSRRARNTSVIFVGHATPTEEHHTIRRACHAHSTPSRRNTQQFGNREGRKNQLEGCSGSEDRRYDRVRSVTLALSRPFPLLSPHLGDWHRSRKSDISLRLCLCLSKSVSKTLCLSVPLCMCVSVTNFLGFSVSSPLPSLGGLASKSKV